MKKMDSFSGEVPHNKQTNPQPQITFYFAECMEFISYGEFRETSTLARQSHFLRSVQVRDCTLGSVSVLFYTITVITMEQNGQ